MRMRTKLKGNSRKFMNVYVIKVSEVSEVSGRVNSGFPINCTVPLIL